MTKKYNAAEGGVAKISVKSRKDLFYYPIDMSAYLSYNSGVMETSYRISYEDCQPLKIICHALAHWNLYLADHKQSDFHAFLKYAEWLVEHEVIIDKEVSGWPILLFHPHSGAKSSCLSALVQGCSISVLIRAYMLTEDHKFLNVACRTVEAFERDIFDGGVSTPLGENGVFFEEIAVYPATHILNGFLFAVLGLYDFTRINDNARILELIQRALATLHRILNEYDTGSWTRRDLLRRQLASSAEIKLQAELLNIIAEFSGCTHYSVLATRWRKYYDSLRNRLRYGIASRCAFFSRAAISKMRSTLFPKLPPSDTLSVCVPLPGHPFTGGILTVLEGITQVMKDVWSIEYLTQRVGPNAERFTMHRFGSSKIGPWYFPLVWIYCIAGFIKLISLRCSGVDYHILLPQDGVFTSAFTALAGKVIGARVVAIDHSTLTWATNSLYRAERISHLKTRNWPEPIRLLTRLLLLGYWPSLALLSRISVQLVDHFLIPGVEGDEIGEVCNRLGIPHSRITRFANVVDVQYYAPLESTSKTKLRMQKGIATDAIVISFVGRLSNEKGLDIAIESIDQMRSALPLEIQTRVRVIIAGSGLLQEFVEQDICRRKLDDVCAVWGEISAQGVRELLAISEIFLYTSTRGACMAMSVLEAMASGCAIVASTEPLSNALLLANGRGIVVSPGNIAQTSQALVRLTTNLSLCEEMGIMARNYVSVHNNPAVLRRTLLRVTHWAELDELLEKRQPRPSEIDEKIEHA